jgi:hypothetical protein
MIHASSRIPPKKLNKCTIKCCKSLAAQLAGVAGLVCCDAVFPCGPPEHPAALASKMREVALRLLLPSLSECVQQWLRECQQELGTADLNKVAFCLLLSLLRLHF